MTPDLRQGRRVRRTARAPPRDAAQPGAARQVHARPRRHHRRRGGADGGRLGRRGRDRPAGVVRRADHLHVVGLPHRPAVPAASSTAASPGSTTTSSRAPTPSPTSTPTPTSRASAAATRPGSRWSSWSGGSWSAGPPGRRRPTASPTCSTCSCRSRGGRLAALPRRHGHRHVHLHDVRRAPHDLGHGGLDAHRAAAPSRRAGRRSTAELDELYADGSEVSFQALREIPRLESAIKEALRLHPPLILLLRVAMEELEVRGLPDRRRQVRGGQPGRVATGSPRTSPTPTPSCPPATSSPARRTGPTRGRGSPSARAGTAAWAPPSP